MNLLKTIFRREQSEAQPEGSQGASGTNWLANLIDGSVEGRAMTLSAVWRCVNLISDSVAVMPLRYKELKNGVYQSVFNDPDHLDYLINVRPNLRQNGFTFKKNIVMHMLLKGNAFVLPVNRQGKAVSFQDGDIDRLVLLKTQPAYDIQRNTYSVTDVEQGVPTQSVRGSQIWHFRNPSTDGGFWGLSTIAQARETLTIAATSEAETKNRFATGGRGKFILGYEGTAVEKSFGNHSQKQLKGAAKDIEEELRNHDIVTMPDKGLTLHQLNMSSQDLQFLESRKFSLEEICRWFGLSPIDLGVQTSNYKSVDAAQVSFYTRTIQPYCSQIECEIHSKITTIEDYMKYKMDFDETPLFALDMDAKAKWMQAQQQMGVKNQNELRSEMDLPPVADGSTYLVSANLKSVSQLKSEGHAQN